MSRRKFARLYRPDPGPQAPPEQLGLYAPDDPGARRQALQLSGAPLGPIGGGELLLRPPPGPAAAPPTLLDVPPTSVRPSRPLAPCILCHQPTEGSVSYYRDPRHGRDSVLSPPVTVPACLDCCARYGLLTIWRAYHQPQEAKTDGL